MPKQTSSSIARKAFARAEADFATWLMMAKLGSFDDLPPNAQKWLMAYRPRLQQMSEADATAATVREVYAAYYQEMGGEGDPPAPSAGVPKEKLNGKGQVVDIKSARAARSQRLPQAPPPRGATARPIKDWSPRTVSPFLIFAGMVALLAAIKFAFF